MEDFRQKQVNLQRAAWRRKSAPEIALPAEEAYRAAVADMNGALMGHNIEAARAALRGLLGEIPVFQEARHLAARLTIDATSLLRNPDTVLLIGSGGSILNWKPLKVKEVRVRRQSGSEMAACDMMQKRRQTVQIMHQSLSAVLFPGYRRRVLGMLMLHPEESLHGREIARRTGLPAGTLTRELKRLADVGLLNCERRGNQLVYSANRQSPIFEELAGILRKTSGLADVVLEALEPITDRIESAFIFGSVARGTETQGSDIDLMIIGSADFGTVVDALHPAQQKLAREINPKVFSTREWKAKVKERNPFVADVMSKRKVFLVGDEDGLTELSRHKPRAGRTSQGDDKAAARCSSASYRRR